MGEFGAGFAEYGPQLGAAGILLLVVGVLLKIILDLTRRHTDEMDNAAKRHADEMRLLQEAHAEEQREIRVNVDDLRRRLAEVNKGWDEERQARRAAEDRADQLARNLGHANDRILVLERQLGIERS